MVILWYSFNMKITTQKITPQFDVNPLVFSDLAVATLLQKNHQDSYQEGYEQAVEDCEETIQRVIFS